MADEFRYEVKIKPRTAYIYRDGSQTVIVGQANKNWKILVTKVSDDKKWYFAPAFNGWIASSNFTITNYNVPEDVPDDKIGGVVNSKNITTSIVNPGNDAAGSVFGSMLSSSMSGVFGLPYQFMPAVDRRLNNDNSGVGRKYAEKILGRNNFLYLQPGNCEFLPGASASERSAALNRLISGEGGINGSGRYYQFALDFSDYYSYVNRACWATASLLGIENQKITINGRTERAGSFPWQEALSSQYANQVLKTSNNIVFYMDGYNSTSEDFGNSTRESSLVSQVNGLSDQVKELNFLLGVSTDTSLWDKSQIEDSATYSTVQESLNDMVSSFTKGTGVLNAILGNSDTILSGGKIVFPELWSDSDYDRSYNIDIKLRSPDADEMSIYLNILVPYIHLMALTAPRDIGKDSVNGYKSPFLVRAFARSMFNIDLGIITSLSVTKGGEGNWAVSTNLPTSIDISLSIKDLYKSLFISNANGRFVTNDAEIEYLMALSGVNYYDISLFNRASLAGTLIGGTISTIPSAIKTRITDYIDQALRPFAFTR